ncbi:MAG: C/D box methylation guide ribonucleoprotein complex aNOP56 subunit [Candidatus Thorarchaeota archaeon]
MKSYIADTLVGIFAFDEAGNILNFIDFNNDYDKIVGFFKSLDNDIIQNVFKQFLFDLKNSGFNEFVFDNKKLEKLTSRNLGYSTSFKSDSLEFRSFRSDLEKNLKKVGINKTQEEILSQYKLISEKLVRLKVSEVSGHSDNVINQIITILDVIKKSISLFSSHLREWYGLHFPELTDKIIDDNIILAKMISILGNRSNFTFQNIKQEFELSEDKAKILEQYALESMGANINLSMIQKYAEQITSLDEYRLQLENHLEGLMKEYTPNINAIIGTLIGAKLIAKAGGLKKLAYMPASRIQLLGAEKALYRFLKTGEKRPKHGLIFQWNQIRSAKPFNRGKIARVVAGKIGIAAKIDYFGGDFIGDNLLNEIELKIKEIDAKYPNPPKKAPSQKRKKKK